MKKNSFVNCLNSFSRKPARDSHQVSCVRHKGVIEKVPSIEDNKISFSRFQNTFKQDLVGYLDFESELVEVGDKCPQCSTIRCKCYISYTRKGIGRAHV